jgi:hypothetical protein
LIHISAALTTLLAGVTMVCVLGLIASLTTLEPRCNAQQRWRLQALALLAAACLLSYLAAVQFGVRFVLTQARYFFPAVNAAALLLMVGLRAWIPVAWRPVMRTVVVFAAIALNLTIYTVYVIPYWYWR